MLPIVLDLTVVPIGVAGAGDGLRRKLHMLAEAGTAPRGVFDGLAPRDADLAGLKVLFVVGLDDEAAANIVERARARGILVNVEDKPELCDFHVPAQMRRGGLLFTVSTGGKSPALSKALREGLERRFGPEWSERFDEIARLREVWRAEGATTDAVASLTRQHLDAHGWLE